MPLSLHCGFLFRAGVVVEVDHHRRVVYPAITPPAFVPLLTLLFVIVLRAAVEARPDDRADAAVVDSLQDLARAARGTLVGLLGAALLRVPRVWPRVWRSRDAASVPRPGLWVDGHECVSTLVDAQWCSE